MDNLFDPRKKHQATILNKGMTALGEQHETTVRLFGGDVRTESVSMCLTNMDSERAKVLGIDLQNNEAVHVTVSLSAIGYLPRPGMDFPLDGVVWKVRGNPFVRGDITRIVLVRRTS